MLNSIYGQLPNAKIRAKEYRFNGTFDEAINRDNLPPDANVKGEQSQPIGDGISMFIAMSESMEPKPMGSEWYARAKNAAKSLGSINEKTWSVTIGRNVGMWTLISINRWVEESSY